MRRKRGQSTVEYLLVFVGVLLAVIFGVKSVLEPGVKGRMDNAGTALTNAGTKLTTSLAP